MQPVNVTPFNCPRCGVQLHGADWSVDPTDTYDGGWVDLTIACWDCTWQIVIKIESANVEADNEVDE